MTPTVHTAVIALSQIAEVMTETQKRPDAMHMIQNVFHQVSLSSVNDMHSQS